jgi:predicted PurR-regulated permease PerM
VTVDSTSGPPVHAALDRGAAYAWRLLVVAAAVVAALWLVRELLVVVLPVIAAILVCRILAPVHRRAVARGVPGGLSAGLLTLGFAIALLGVVALLGASIVGQLDDLDETIEQGIEDVEDWLVDDAPFEVDRAQVERARESIGDRVRDALDRSDGRLTEGAVLAGEVVAGLVLTLVLTFLLLKDGARYVGRLERLRADRADTLRRCAMRAWAALGGYLRGAALLGLVEALAIGLTMLLVGADLVLPVMAITVLGAFVPIVGAIAAGLVAVVVTLATAGGFPALVVLAVAVVVQQLDNDLLAPWIYGRALRLPALAILLGVASGVALFGIVGAFLAVPVLAVGVAVGNELRETRQRSPGSQASPSSSWSSS